MSRNAKIGLGIAVVVVAGYLAWRWWQNRQAAQQQPGSPTGAYGTNLNSVAPELTGGSAGPSVGPAVSLPVHITIEDKRTAVGPDLDRMTPMVPQSRSANPVYRQRMNAGVVNGSGMGDSEMTTDTGTSQDTTDRTGATFDTADQAGG